MNYLDKSIISSVFRIEFNNQAASSIMFRLNPSYIGFITAKHLFDKIDGIEGHFLEEDYLFSFQLTKMHENQDLSGKVYYGTNNSDIAIIVVKNSAESTLLNQDSFLFDLEDLIISEDFFMIGFPFVMNDNIKELLAIPDTDYLCGFVKHGYISGVGVANNVNLLFLDIHNNKGFSGSPICCYKKGRYKIAGIINKFYCDMFDTGINPESNSGIALGVNIIHIKPIIDRFSLS